MSPAARVSVILPVRDAERTVGAAVQSLLAGTLPEIEVLAVDDGSQDGTRPLLDSMARADPRLVILEGGGRGLVAALNLGLERSRAPYVARMDADDWAYPRRLERSVAALEEEAGLAGVGTGVEIFREDRPVSPSLQAYARWLNGLTTPERLFRERFVESPLCHPSVCLRRAVLADVGGWPGGDLPEDYGLWLELLDRGHRLKTLPQVLLRWRDHEGRLTRTDPRYALRRFTALKARYLARSLRGTPCSILGTGPEALALMRLLRQDGIQVERLVDVSPRKIGNRVEGVPIVGLESLGPPGGDHRILCVGSAREELRARLIACGHREGEHFTCAA